MRVCSKEGENKKLIAIYIVNNWKKIEKTQKMHK